MNEYPLNDYASINPELHTLWHEVDRLFARISQKQVEVNKLTDRIKVVEANIADHQMKITLLESQLRNSLHHIEQVAQNVPSKNDYDE